MLTYLLTIFTVSTIVLAIVVYAYHLRVETLQQRVLDARSDANDARRQMIGQSRRLADLAGTDNVAFLEMLLSEANITSRIKSNIWEVDLPYSTWGLFPGAADTPPAMIRGFWPDMPGKLMGVRIQPGTIIETHEHPWKEILVGIRGTVTVVIDPDGEPIHHELGPGEVVEINPDQGHAILKAEEPAKVICIWGEPITA